MALRKSRDGTWIVDVSNGINPISLKQRRIVRKGFKTKKEAVAYANSFCVDIANGLNVIDNKVL